jgi:hypothetical protein
MFAAARCLTFGFALAAFSAADRFAIMAGFRTFRAGEIGRDASQ